MVKVTVKLKNGAIQTFFMNDCDRCGIGPPGIHFFCDTSNNCRKYEVDDIIQTITEKMEDECIS